MKEEMFDYKRDAIKRISLITDVKVFFFMQELPLEFTEQLTSDDIQRFAKFVTNVQHCSNMIRDSMASSEYSQLEDDLDELKYLFAHFISNLEPDHLFEIINMYPFLILEEDEAYENIRNAIQAVGDLSEESF